MTTKGNVIGMAKANTVETIEEYLLRLEHALAPQGEFWQNELLPQRRTRHMVKVSFSAPKEHVRADIAREVELQLRDIGLWREDLSVKVKDFDWECCEIQNEGCSLIGTLWVEFGVWGGGALLWSAHADLLCDHDLANGLGDDELDGLDELDEDEAAAWWLARGVDIEEVSDFDCPLIDMGEVELANQNEKTSCVRSTNSVKVTKPEDGDGPVYRGVGWKQQGNSAYEPLLLKRTLYEVSDPEFDEYRVERQRIVDAIPRDIDEDAKLEDLTLHAHFFGGGWDWYVASYDPETDIAFGYVVGIDDEWGDFWLREVETTQIPVEVHLADGSVCRVPGPYVECDICWQPITFGELLERRGGAQR
jgi:hypothetical protein